MNKNYEVIDVAKMLPDPQRAARAYELVGKHDPLTRQLIGAWRWPALHAYPQDMRNVATSRYVLDIGGAAGPIGYSAVIVDPLGDVPTIFDVEGEPSGAFLVHTLEHLADPDGFLAALKRKLMDGGYFVCVVPSFRKQHLRASCWPWHRSTYRLAADDGPSEAQPVDSLIGQHFEVLAAETHADDCFVLARA